MVQPSNDRVSVSRCSPSLTVAHIETLVVSESPVQIVAHASELSLTLLSSLGNCHSVVVCWFTGITSRASCNLFTRATSRATSTPRDSVLWLSVYETVVELTCAGLKKGCTDRNMCYASSILSRLWAVTRLCV